jgi:hypothetical protein
MLPVIHNFELSTYLDKISWALYLLLPIWPLLKFASLSSKKRNILIAVLTVVMWAFIFVSSAAIFRLSIYTGILFFEGIWTFTGWLVSFVYASILALVVIVLRLRITSRLASSIIDVLYLAIYGLYTLILLHLAQYDVRF